MNQAWHRVKPHKQAPYGYCVRQRDPGIDKFHRDTTKVRWPYTMGVVDKHVKYQLMIHLRVVSVTQLGCPNPSVVRLYANDNRSILSWV